MRISDWSSDVCSSDLPAYGRAGPRPGTAPGRPGRRVAGAVGGRTGMDLDQGGRQLAGLVLDAAGRGQHDQVADLIAPLDVDQLRSLVTVLAVQVDQTLPSAPADRKSVVQGKSVSVRVDP